MAYDLRPQATKDMEELLIACDKALNSCDKALQDEKEVNRIQEEFIGTQSKRIGELESQVNSFWSNPLMWFVLGVATGTTTIILLK